MSAADGTIPSDSDYTGSGSTTVHTPYQQPVSPNGVPVSLINSLLNNPFANIGQSNTSVSSPTVSNNLWIALGIFIVLGLALFFIFEHKKP